jgi:hypothetical protein
MVNPKLKNIIKKLILEAYVDYRGELQDFDTFETPKDMSPLYDPTLKKSVNRMKALGGGTVLKIDIEEPYQQRAFRKVLKIATEKGIKMYGGVLKLPNFTYKRIGKIDMYSFSNKYSNLIKTIIINLSKTDTLSPYFDAYAELIDKIR